MEEMTKCPKCKTRTLHRDGQELVCSECKGRFPAPVKNAMSMSRAEVMKRHQYYESNRQPILADVEAIGQSATAKKWKIPTGSLSIKDLTK